MARAELILTGFKQLEDRLNVKKFEKRLKKNLKKATKKVGITAVGEIQSSIYAGKSIGKNWANSPATAAIKGSSRPLVDNGDLVKSITHKAIAFDEVLVGLLKSKAIKDKKTGKVIDVKELGAILHSGARIKVTTKMRRMFWALATQFPDQWHPLSAGTTEIVIPARPFLRFAITKKASAKYKKIWSDAIDQTFKGQ